MLITTGQDKPTRLRADVEAASALFVDYLFQALLFPARAHAIITYDYMHCSQPRHNEEAAHAHAPSSRSPRKHVAAPPCRRCHGEHRRRRRSPRNTARLRCADRRLARVKKRSATLMLAQPATADDYDDTSIFEPLEYSSPKVSASFPENKPRFWASPLFISLASCTRPARGVVKHHHLVQRLKNAGVTRQPISDSRAEERRRVTLL